MTYLKKAACFTDIHWGRKNNSVEHNEDCTRFIRWFIGCVQSDPSIDHIIFTGDWFEQRAAINSLTWDYAFDGAELLASLGLPIYFIVGNHDLYYRTTRDVHSTRSFSSLGFTVVNDPTVFENIGPSGTLICPFLFEGEYAGLAKYFTTPVWFGHFEFKGFVLTGETKKMEHGPDPQNFTGPKQIFSGHFHKRQNSGNITYIGNAFPCDFADANDIHRGMMTYDHDADAIEFADWDECPSYIRTTLSEIIDDPAGTLRKDAIVNCIVDKEINYEQSIKLREQLVVKYKLRELNLQENPDVLAALEGTEVDSAQLDEHLETTSTAVRLMLGNIDADSIDNNKLINIWDGLK